MKRRNQDTQPDTLAAELQRIGFSDYEAKAYVALLQLPTPSTAYEISKVAGIPRANAYSVLEVLSGKRAVQPVSQSPLRYAPVEPDVLLGRIVEETAASCHRLEQKLGELRKGGAGNDYVWSLSGEFEVNAKIREMIDTAQDHIWIKSHEAILLPHEGALRKAAERGVQVLIILFGTEFERFDFGPNSRTYLHEGNGIPVGIAHHLVTLTRDFSEALMVNMHQTPYGAHTSSRPVVNMADTMIRHEIYFAEIFAHLGDEIHAIFGPAMLDLRRRYLPKEQSDNLLCLLDGAAVDGPSAPKSSPAQGTKKKEA